VTRVFGPRFVTVTVFKARNDSLPSHTDSTSARRGAAADQVGAEKELVKGALHLGLDAAPPTFASVEGYRAIDRVLYEFDHYWLRYGYYPLWTRYTPTALERTVALINSHPVVLFARRSCDRSKKMTAKLAKSQIEFRLVYLDDITAGNIMQRRLQELTGQWTVPSVFVKSQHIGGYKETSDAIKYGKVKHILDSGEWMELVYAVRPDAWARDTKLKEKSPMSFDMCLQDSHKFHYVHRQRWAKVKRYWGEHPAIEDIPAYTRSFKKI
ncbi:glutaredoxin, partial [Linderina macrospora]